MLALSCTNTDWGCDYCDTCVGLIPKNVGIPRTQHTASLGFYLSLLHPFLNHTTQSAKYTYSTVRIHCVTASLPLITAASLAIAVKVPAQQCNVSTQTTGMQKAPIPAPAFLPAQLRTARAWLLRGSSTSALLCRYSLGKHALPLGSFSSKPNSSLQPINKAISSASLEGKEMKKGEVSMPAVPCPHHRALGATFICLQT